MKVCKKIYIYFLVGFLCLSTVLISYQKADTCKAVSIGIEIGVIITGLMLSGAYIVATDEDVQRELKETYTDYKNATVENSKMLYETNKQLFNDFVAYAEENGAGSMCLYSSAGSSYSVSELSQAGFPDFDEWDDYFKKSSGSGGGWNNLWDKIMLGADILGLLKNFCNDNFYTDGIDGQLFYTGDDGYIDRETAQANIYFEIRDYYNADYAYKTATFSYNGDITELGNFNANEFKICAFANVYLTYHSCGGWSCRHVVNAVFNVYLNALYDDGSIGQISLPYSYNGAESTGSSYSGGGSFGIKFFDHGTGTYYGNTYIEELGRTLTIDDLRRYPDYISGNIPFFSSSAEASAYLSSSDTVAVQNKLSNTVSDRFMDNYSGSYVTVQNIVNDVNNYYDTGDDDSNDDTTIVVTATPVPTLSDDDGSNTTNNYIINITNILQPINETVTNIYNFFVIDTEAISLEINNIDVIPASKFTNFVQTFANLKNTFSDNTQDEFVSCSSQRGIVYPILKVQCPKILTDFLPDNDDVVLFEDDIAYIILCDCGKYAVQFGAVRLILKVVMWFGFIFYVLRELKVVITLSS